MSYNRDVINQLIDYIYSLHGKTTKEELRASIINTFQLTAYSKSLFYNNDFAIRFSHTSRDPCSISNTILSLKSLLDLDDSVPVFLCVIWKTENVLYMMNTTFINKISHSSKWLRHDNIVWSFLGQDIMQEYNWISNTPNNFETLWYEHLNNGGSKWNLDRIINNTQNIVWILKPFHPTPEEENNIYKSIDRLYSAKKEFILSDVYYEFQDRIYEFYQEILFAAKNIDNVNLRGNILEYLIVHWDNTDEWIEIINALRNQNTNIDVNFSNWHDLGDTELLIWGFHIAIDVKTKIISENSNSEPKVYNIDKFLEFLSKDNTVFLILFVGIDIENNTIEIALRSPFDVELLEEQSIQSVWAWRWRRGTVQYSGNSISKVLFRQPKQADYIDTDQAYDYILYLLNLDPAENIEEV